jgi:hypothetical protein|nr:MAG TPA: hypothetical protein [Caudoviricetes sp.]
MKFRRKLIKKLVKALAEQPEVECGSVGPYQEFEIKRKYSSNRTEITDATVLIIHHLVL